MGSGFNTQILGNSNGLRHTRQPRRIIQAILMRCREHRPPLCGQDIPPINSQAQERLGYPTQKPVALLERIIQASSNPGDVVLDPFCGCGTTIHAAQKLGRQWLGIDITHLAISLIEKRLKDAFPGIQYEVHGTPKDITVAPRPRRSRQVPVPIGGRYRSSMPCRSAARRGHRHWNRWSDLL